MNSVAIDLPRDIKQLRIEAFADVHIGDKECDMKLLHERIRAVQDDDNCYCILNGDLIDNATKSSIGDIYSNTLTPMEQMKACMGLFEPIKDKILSVAGGNHEARTYRLEGIDLTWFLVNEFKIESRWLGAGGVVFLKLGENINRHHTRKGEKKAQIQYSIYHTHGRGGGRKAGAKAIRLEDMAAIVDCDIYIHSHSHFPMVLKKNYFRVNEMNKQVKEVEKLFVYTGAYLNYGGYGQIQEYTPSSRSNPIILLDGTKKEAKALL